MNYYRFRAELTDPQTGKKKTRVISVRSNHISGAMRKAYQDYEGINVVAIL